MLPQDVEGNVVDRSLVSRREDHWRRNAIEVGSQPVAGGDTPPIPGSQARESELRHRSSEVVADRSLVLEELGGHHRADRVTPAITRIGAAGPVAKPSGDRIGSTRFEVASEDVAIGHTSSITGDCE